MFCAKHRDSNGKNRCFWKKVAKNRTLISFYLALNWPLVFILLPIGVEFQVELHGTKKSTYRKSPKQRDSNGRPEYRAEKQLFKDKNNS